MSEQFQPQNDLANTGQTDEDILAATTGDCGGLRSDDVHLILSRFADEEGYYNTKVQVSRPTRRLYVLGLLTEAITMLGMTGAEYITPEDSIGDDGCEEEYDDEDLV